LISNARSYPDASVDQLLHILQPMASGMDPTIRRTLLAQERTLMAWIRTSVSLISFGFTIYKFFQYLVQEREANLSRVRFGPRAYALTMIGLGVLALAIGLVDYRHARIELNENRDTYYSPAGMFAFAILLMGFLLMSVVLLHL
jgi:putative membrane protein